MTGEKRREYDRRWYREHKVTYNKVKSRRKIELRQWFDGFKAILKCYLCNENHIACLDFHHINPADKEISIADAVRKGWGKTRILKEIAKCKVLCANCHRKFHAKGKVQVQPP